MAARDDRVDIIKMLINASKIDPNVQDQVSTLQTPEFVYNKISQ